jgi:predicted RNA binding protein YcfA (HicA-like mRNA interferase family)
MYVIWRIIIMVMGIVYTAKELRKMAEKTGFVFSRQKGSHAIYKHADGRQTVIPMHNNDVPKGTANSIIKDIEGGK